MKSLKIVKAEYRRVGYDETDIEKTEYVETEASYNEAGQLVKEQRFDPDGNVNTVTINEFDKNGNLFQSEQYDQDNILLQKSVNQYDEDGLLVQQSNYFGDGSTEYITRFVYDNVGHEIRREMYYDGRLDYVEREMEYQNGRLVKDTENDDYGNTMNIYFYEYDDKGQVVKHIREEVQNKDRRTYEYEYDEKGNRIKELVYDYNDMLIAKTYRKYNENNLLKEIEEEDLDNYRKITLEYENNIVVKNSILNKEGELQGWAEYTYDENGKENSSREFIKDEIQPENFRLLRETRYERD
ncbi:MAG: hypothetical protein K5636_00550 [Bacteroidales bacterium]|nr:hypothetical protein [Bacteroidales bacterium]